MSIGPVATGLCCLSILGVAVPVAVSSLWGWFKDGFLGALAPVEHTSGKGQVSIMLNTVLSVVELVVVALWGVGVGVTGVGGAGELLFDMPNNILRGATNIYELQCVGICVRWGIYITLGVLWTISYMRAVETRSDSLFTIDKQKDEVICEKCSRLVYTHTQHCAFCWRCVERFDHHSFLINNCVAERNGKSYTLALLYGFLRPLAALSFTVPLLFTRFSILATAFAVLAVFCSLVFAACYGFLLVVWIVSVTYGFNTVTETGQNAVSGTSSLEVLFPMLTLLTHPTLHRPTWSSTLELPYLTASAKRKNWAMMMGVHSRAWWWWPSSPYSFPDYGQSAFVFKKAW